MTDYIDCTPHPALGLAWQIVENLKKLGIVFDYEGEALLSAHAVLRIQEQRGNITFADEPKAEYVPASTSTATTLALRELVAAISDHEAVCNIVFDKPRPEAANVDLHIRDALSKAEEVLGL